MNTVLTYNISKVVFLRILGDRAQAIVATCFSSKWLIYVYIYIYIFGGGSTEDCTQALSVPDKDSATVLYPSLIVN